MESVRATTNTLGLALNPERLSMDWNLKSPTGHQQFQGHVFPSTVPPFNTNTINNKGKNDNKGGPYMESLVMRKPDGTVLHGQQQQAARRRSGGGSKQSSPAGQQLAGHHHERVLGDNNKEKEVIALPDVHANEFKSS
jgi:hypothetical protein